MVISQVEAERHAIALHLVSEWGRWQMDKLSSSDFLARISAKRDSGASAIDRQRANELEAFVTNRKV